MFNLNFTFQSSQYKFYISYISGNQNCQAGTEKCQVGSKNCQNGNDKMLKIE